MFRALFVVLGGKAEWQRKSSLIMVFCRKDYSCAAGGLLCSQKPKQCLSFTTPLSVLLISEIDYCITIKIFFPCSPVNQLTGMAVYHPIPKERPYTVM